MLLRVNTDIEYITNMAVDPNKMTRKLVSLPHEMVQAISDYRFAQKIGSESEAIRRLIEAGLKSEASEAGK